MTGKTDFDRFDASLRTRFTNDTDGGDAKAFYFRPRTKHEYNIKGSKIEPFASYELFMNLDESNFFSLISNYSNLKKSGKFIQIIYEICNLNAEIYTIKTKFS